MLYKHALGIEGILLNCAGIIGTKHTRMFVMKKHAIMFVMKKMQEFVKEII